MAASGTAHPVRAGGGAGTRLDVGPSRRDAGGRHRHRGSAVDGRVTVLDARAPERFRGEVEPLDPIAGHIPGATNLPLTELLDAEGAFLPSEEIRRRFDAVSSDRPLIASCGSGVTACHLVLAAELIESDVALYPGSFSGWIGAGNPVEVGDPASLPG
ncbi:MAG: rhodanese-like domain-containing protein [Nakamurella sp.]